MRCAADRSEHAQQPMCVCTPVVRHNVLKARSLFSGSRISDTARMRPVSGSAIMNQPLRLSLMCPSQPGASTTRSHFVAIFSWPSIATVVNVWVIMPGLACSCHQVSYSGGDERTRGHRSQSTHAATVSFVVESHPTNTHTHTHTQHRLRHKTAHSGDPRQLCGRHSAAHSHHRITDSRLNSG